LNCREPIYSYPKWAWEDCTPGDGTTDWGTFCAKGGNLKGNDITCPAGTTPDSVNAFCSVDGELHPDPICNPGDDRGEFVNAGRCYRKCDAGYSVVGANNSGLVCTPTCEVWKQARPADNWEKPPDNLSSSNSNYMTDFGVKNASISCYNDTYFRKSTTITSIEKRRKIPFSTRPENAPATIFSAENDVVV
jgi:hypothetical protein